MDNQGSQNSQVAGAMPEMNTAAPGMPPVVDNGAPMPEMGMALPAAPPPQVDGAMMPEMGGGAGTISSGVPMAGAPEVLETPIVEAQEVPMMGAAPTPEVPATPELNTSAPAETPMAGAVADVPMAGAPETAMAGTSGVPMMGMTQEEGVGMTAAEAQANMQEVNQMAPTPSMIESANAPVQVKTEKKKGGLSELFKKKEKKQDTGTAAVAPEAEGALGVEGAPAKAGKQSFSEWFKNASFSDLLKPRAPKNVSGVAEDFEINLIPSIKSEALAAIRSRNMILFVCIVIVAGLGGLVAILGSIHGAKSIQMSGQDDKLDALSKKINSFDGLEEYLTIQDQLGGIASINEKRQVLSRVFPFIAAIQPEAPDSVTISKMAINMETDTVSFDGQASAGVAPFINFRVLEAFKKSTEEMKYDYGNYVDKDGNEIPARCMVENGTNGNTLVENGSTYAYWMVTKDECDEKWRSRSADVAALEEDIMIEEAEKKNGESGESRSKEERFKEIYDEYDEEITKNWYDDWLKRVGLTRYTDSNLSEQQIASREASWGAYYNGLDDEGKWMADKMVNENKVRKQDVYFEKVYRTPQFSEWSKENSDGESYMTLSGEISGIPHFESQCNRYSGMEVENNKVMWTTENECLLIDGEMEISNPSDGMDTATGRSVLKFSASFVLNKEPMNFNNKHVMAIAPNGKNVTDSYIQIEGMFGREAEDCDSSNVVCTNTSQNTNGGNNGE